MTIARPYQRASLHGGDGRGIGAFKAWETCQSTLIQLPTGAGKTFVAAECIKSQLGRVMFAVHLREIIWDARKALHKFTGLDVGLELASSRESSLNPEPIIIASIQTLNSNGRLQKFDPLDFTLLIFDEAHRGISDTWLNVANHFRQNPNLKVLCLSATPERSDKKNLSALIESVAYEYPLQDAINDGWLVRPRQRLVEIEGMDLSKIKTRAGDLSKDELAKEMERIAIATAHRSIEAIFGMYPRELANVPEENWDTYIADRRARRTLAFCASIEHARKTAAALNSVREGLCGFVSGETPHDERRDIFRRFKTGELPCLANCGVTVEGYDNPFIEVILMLRPTKSRPLFLQCIGRGTRTLPGVIDGLDSVEERLAAILASPKKYIEIVDFVGNSGKHKLISLIDIFDERVTPNMRREIEKRAKENAVDVEQEIKIIGEERARYALHATSFNEEEIDGFTGKRKKKRRKKDPNAPKRPVSSEEFIMLQKQKLKPESRSEEENRALLKKIRHRRIAGLCSFSQGFTLQKFGYAKQDLEKMTFTQASELIDAIAKNGWRKPANEIPSFTQSLVNETQDDYYRSLDGGPAF